MPDVDPATPHVETVDYWRAMHDNQVRIKQWTHGEVVRLRQALVEVSAALGYEWDPGDPDCGDDPAEWATARAWEVRGEMAKLHDWLDSLVREYDRVQAGEGDPYMDWTPVIIDMPLREYVDNYRRYKAAVGEDVDE